MRNSNRADGRTEDGDGGKTKTNSCLLLPSSLSLSPYPPCGRQSRQTFENPLGGTEGGGGRKHASVPRAAAWANPNSEPGEPWREWDPRLECVAAAIRVLSNSPANLVSGGGVRRRSRGKEKGSLRRKSATQDFGVVADEATPSCGRKTSESDCIRLRLRLRQKWKG